MCTFMPYIQEAKCLKFTVQTLPPRGAPRGAKQICPPPSRFIFVFALDYARYNIMVNTITNGSLPEYSIECHGSRHICEESEKEEESCQVGHRGDGTKDISVSDINHSYNKTNRQNLELQCVLLKMIISS